MTDRSQQARPAPVFLRLTLPNGEQLGPGKVALMEAIGQAGSITGAARRLRMSYRRAWRLVEAVNRLTTEPLISTQQGGAAGGGAALTSAGERLIARYRALEGDTAGRAADLIAELS